MPTEPYILIYKLYGFDRKFDNYAETFSQKTGLPIVRICTNYAQYCENIFRHEEKIILPDPFKLISLIDNARFLITNSFHGTAFALNMNTEPVCIYPERFAGRIESILRLTGTLDRRVRSMDDFGVIDRHVDFGHVNSVLDAERRKVSDWLKMVLAEIQQHNS